MGNNGEYRDKIPIATRTGMQECRGYTIYVALMGCPRHGTMGKSIDKLLTIH